MFDTWTQTSVSPDQGTSQRWNPDQRTNSANRSNASTSEVEPRHQVRTEPGQKTTKPDGKPKDSFELSREAEEIRQLQLRDREVRAHEEAHAAAGGAHAGSPSYQYERGPDGKTYATGGEVSIDLSKVSGDPEATLKKAEQIRAAALAPAEPSAQDLKVAQKAQAMANQARTEIAQQYDDESSDSSVDAMTESSPAASGVESKPADQPARNQSDMSGSFSQGATHLSIYS